jgi:hypothetical protein
VSSPFSFMCCANDTSDPAHPQARLASATNPKLGQAGRECT